MPRFAQLPRLFGSLMQPLSDLSAACISARRENWSQFRGANANGVVSEGQASARVGTRQPDLVEDRSARHRLVATHRVGRQDLCDHGRNGQAIETRSEKQGAGLGGYADFLSARHDEHAAAECQLSLESALPRRGDAAKLFGNKSPAKAGRRFLSTPTIRMRRKRPSPMASA